MSSPYLKLDPQRVLRHTVEASLVALAPLVAFEDTRRHSVVQPAMLVAHVLLDLCVRIGGDGVTDGLLPAGALLLVLAVVGAIAAGQKLFFDVDVDVSLRDSVTNKQEMSKTDKYFCASYSKELKL